MEATLPARDFCYRHLADTTLPPVITTHQRRPISKVLWLTLLASVLLHLALVWWWAEQQPQVSTKAQPLLISLVTPAEQAPEQEPTETAVPETAMAEPAADTPIAEPAPAAEQVPVKEIPVTAEPPAELDLSLPETQPSSIQPSTPQTDDAPNRSGTVFHPGLRGQIQSARSTRERLHNNDTPLLNSWQDATGSTWVDMGNGLCMRSAGETDGITQSWELPTRCRGQFTEGERMLRNMQRDVDRQSR